MLDPQQRGQFERKPVTSLKGVRDGNRIPDRDHIAHACVQMLEHRPPEREEFGKPGIFDHKDVVRTHFAL